MHNPTEYDTLSEHHTEYPAFSCPTTNTTPVTPTKHDGCLDRILKWKHWWMVFMIGVLLALGVAVCVTAYQEAKRPPSPTLYRVEATVGDAWHAEQVRYNTSDPTGGIKVTPLEGMKDTYRYEFSNGTTIIGTKITVKIKKR